MDIDAIGHYLTPTQDPHGVFHAPRPCRRRTRGPGVSAWKATGAFSGTGPALCDCLLLSAAKRVLSTSFYALARTRAWRSLLPVGLEVVLEEVLSPLDRTTDLPLLGALYAQVGHLTMEVSASLSLQTRVELLLGASGSRDRDVEYLTEYLSSSLAGTFNRLDLAAQEEEKLQGLGPRLAVVNFDPSRMTHGANALITCGASTPTHLRGHERLLALPLWDGTPLGVRLLSHAGLSMLESTPVPGPLARRLELPSVPPGQEKAFYEVFATLVREDTSDSFMNRLDVVSAATALL